MTCAECGEVSEGVEAAPDFSAIAVLFGKGSCQVLELSDQRLSLFLRFDACVLEERFGKHDFEKSFLVDRIGGIRDHAESVHHIPDDRILSQCASVRETTRHARGKKRRLGCVSDLVSSI